MRLSFSLSIPSWLTFSLLLFMCASASAKNQDIVLGSFDYNIYHYNKWLDNRHCIDIKSYQNKHAFRATIEMLLLCKALHLGGLESEIKLVEYPYYSRIMFETKQGNVAMPADTAWLNSIDPEHYYKTDAIFNNNEFIKGFYVLPEKREKIEEKLNKDRARGLPITQTFRDYSIVSSSGWKNDWDILKKLQLSLLDAKDTITMCTVMASKRIDFYFGELMMKGNSDLPIRCNGTELVPVRGIKVEFPETRHFIVSKRYPNSKKIFIALQKGIKILESSGELTRAMYPYTSTKTEIQNWQNVYLP